MEIVTQIFNNREIAISIWLTILFILMLLKKEIRHSFLSVFEVFFKSNIFLMYLIMTTYVSLMILVLQQLGIWNLILLKESIYWYFGVAVISLLNANKINRDEDYFKKLLINFLTLITILEFITNLYSFDLIIELVLVPSFLFISAMAAVSSIKKEYQKVGMIFNSLLSIIGLTILLYSIVIIIYDPSSLFNKNNITSFFLAPLLTMLYLPFIYCFLLFLSYETLFQRLKYFIKNKSDIKVAKWKILFSFHFKLRELNRFAKEYAYLSEENNNDIVTVINLFKSNKYLKTV